MKQIYRDITQ